MSLKDWDATGKPVVTKTLAQWAAEAAGAGGAVCPGCGRRLFAYRTETRRTTIIRYETCQTPGCERRFMTKQPHREIIKEIKPNPDELSSSGNAT
jgi:hypothetical protein